MKMKAAATLSIVLVSTTLVLAVPQRSTQQQRQEDENSLDRLETKLTRTMDEINARDSIDIYGDMITLEKVPASSMEPANDKSNSHDDPLVGSIERFLETRCIHVNLPNDGSTADLFGRALGQKNIDVRLDGLTHGTSEARTKLKRMVLPILLALKLKLIIVLPIIITLIGLIGLKGLGAGLLSLLLSGAVALKALLTPPPSYPARVSYGIVKPHDIHHEHWHRSQEEVEQPYRGWAPEYNNAEQYPYHDAP